MALTQPHTHDELLTLARKLEAAACDGDADRVESAALKLNEALVDHLDVERLELLRLPPAQTRLITRGQQRVLAELAELVALALAHAPGRCRCAAGAADVLARLYLQAGDERHALAQVTS